MTFTYHVKRTASYQAVDVGASLEVELSAGENAREAFDKGMRYICGMVEAEADERLREVLHLSSSEH